MEKILVTGATGFIGDHIIHQLLKHNETSKDDVAIVATSTSSKKAMQYPWFDTIHYLPALLDEPLPSNISSYYDYFDKPDTLIHLAWSNLPHYEKLSHLENDLFWNYFFLKDMIESGVKKIIVSGTCFEYGLQEGCLSEEHCTKPNSPYSLAKDTLRKFLEQLQRAIPFNLTWLRLFYTHGKNQNPISLFGKLDYALQCGDQNFDMSPGDQTRDYLSAEKMAENIVKISLQSKVDGIINCCSGEPIQLKDLVNNYLQQNNHSIDINFGALPYPAHEPMSFWGDTKKMQLALSAYEENCF